MRWFFLIFAFLVIAAVVGLRERGTKFSRPPFELFNDMDRQYKVKYQKPSRFFPKGIASQPPVEGTIPLGFHFPISKEAGVVRTDLDFSVGDDYYNTGRFGDFYGKGFPEEVEVDDELLARGKERYQIFCSPCHGDSGNGQGVVSKYWGNPPAQEKNQSDEDYLKTLSEFNGIPVSANLLSPLVKGHPEGRIFDVITNGNGGLMGPYKGVINVKDRWAILAYVKALQAASN